MSRRYGYTLVEALAVTLIMISLTTVLLANYDTGRGQQKMAKAASEAQQALRDIQSYALGSTAVGVGTTHAYGLLMSTNASGYTLFADKNNNKLYDAGTDTVISTRTFVDGVLPVIHAAGCAPTAVTTAQILFAPPHPVLSTGQGTSSFTACSAVCLNFQNPSGQTIQRVSVVQNSGLIETKMYPASQIATCP